MKRACQWLLVGFKNRRSNNKPGQVTFRRKTNQGKSIVLVTLVFQRDGPMCVCGAIVSIRSVLHARCLIIMMAVPLMHL